MSVFSTLNTASETVQPRHVLHWLWFRLNIYLAVAVTSALLFFAGAFLYEQFAAVPQQTNPSPEIKTPEPSKPLSTPKPEDDLIVKLPSGQELPFESLYKRVVTDKAGENVGYVVGMSPTSANQAIVVAVESNGSNKTVGVPALTLIGVDSKKNLQFNLPRETIVTSPTYANIGGVWQPTDRAPNQH